MTIIETISINNTDANIESVPKDIAVLFRPMHINDIRTIYEIQKEMFPTDDLYEEYEAFKSKFTVFPQGCWCVDLILDNENSDDIKFFQNYEPSDDLELNKKKLLGHFFSHPWFKDQFPPLNNPVAVKAGVSKIVNPETGEFYSDSGEIMLYLNEIAVRPRVKGFNLARILTRRVLHHLYQNNPLFDHMGLVSVQGSFKVWGSVGFSIDNNLPEEKKKYLIKSYGDEACYMKMKYTLSDLYIKNKKIEEEKILILLNQNNNNHNNKNNNLVINNNVFNYGNLFKEIRKISKL
ncbi:hypothetical protein DICPUDRAFT_154457 [Dictyostelium purpureum]|uniref:Uncharacterized protein n=1 Tax=Dictyostelium purpureum TaxID=5786 RepID=F0ZRD5_DICPU|nr:uncharacterized protein DICPUDRAFT_154457 [Dictyostelium purpureum]EGC33508.1 hypothetical protein DICPUDRAFT_154457 [Dictyostelium purpureum]|eukprot:XP_003289982.1 hypothetical protein DICPUDRAFT_154457 [Dictyostelium purpureum]